MLNQTNAFEGYRELGNHPAGTLGTASRSRNGGGGSASCIMGRELVACYVVRRIYCTSHLPLRCRIW